MCTEVEVNHMTQEEIFGKLKILIVKKIEKGDNELTEEMIKLESHFIDDLGADSLEVLELIMAIEDEFDLDEIPEEDIEGIRTVKNAVDYLVAKLG